MIPNPCRPYTWFEFEQILCQIDMEGDRVMGARGGSRITEPLFRHDNLKYLKILFNFITSAKGKASD